MKGLTAEELMKGLSQEDIEAYLHALKKAKAQEG